jgi:hypothetical protein
MLIISLTSRGSFSKNSSWQAKQSILHCCDMLWWLWRCAKTSPPNFGNGRTSRCITTMHHLTLHFLLKDHDCFPPRTLLARLGPPPTFLFPRLKMKLKGCHFHTVEVTEVEFQAVLNTLTKHDF